MTSSYKTIGWLPKTANFVRPSKPAVTPQYYGAVADGVTNDSAAIQAAVDSGTSVYFPDGTYLVEDTISMSSITDMSLFATGDVTLKLADSRPLETRMFHVYQCNNVYFSGLKFDGNKANQTQPDPGGSWEGVPGRIYFTPIWVELCDHINVVNCEMYDVCTASVNLSESTNVKIADCHFHDCYMDPIFSSHEANNGVVIDNNVIENITYRDSEDAIIYRYGNGIVVNASNMRITNNTIRYCDRSGLKPTTYWDMHDIYIANNDISYCDWQGINPHGGYNFVIENNTLDNMGWNGILIANAESDDHVRNIKILNNQITNTGTRDTGEAGITSKTAIKLVENTNTVYIANNTIDTTVHHGMLLGHTHSVHTYNNTITNTGYSPIAIGAGQPQGSEILAYNILMEDDVIYCNDTVDGIKVIDYSYDITIRNVEIHDAVQYGIILYYSDNTLIERCTIDGANEYAMRLIAPTNTVIRGNIFSNIAIDGIIFLKLNVDEADTALLTKNVFRSIVRDGVRIYDSPANLTIADDNIFVDIGGDDVYYF